MTDSGPRLLALDFDGVLCDGRREYVETARRAYAAAWPGACAVAPALDEDFAALRPLVESGWEMPVLVRALAVGAIPRTLGNRRAWLDTAAALMADAGVTRDALARAMDAARDAWLDADPCSWIAHHAFYPGVVPRLAAARAAGVPVAVVTTKTTRFTRRLLESASPALADVPVVGRVPGGAVPKPETLLRLAADHGLADGAGLWFVEDMLDTLEATAARPELGAARLFLAAWGYNTLEQRARVGWSGRVGLLSLAVLAGPFTAWPDDRAAARRSAS